jgi:hypothetical protein
MPSKTKVRKIKKSLPIYQIMIIYQISGMFVWVAGSQMLVDSPEHWQKAIWALLVAFFLMVWGDLQFEKFLIEGNYGR